MNQDHNKERALSDIRLIHEILSRTLVSYKKVAPAFYFLGILWGIYALLSIGNNVSATLRLFYTTATPDSILFLQNNIYAFLEFSLCLVLIVFCIIWGKKRTGLSLEPFASKLINIWGIFMILFIMVKPAFLLFPAFSHELNNLLAHLNGVVVVGDAALFVGAGFAERFLPVILPALPLMITGTILGNRKIFNLGLITLLVTLLSAPLSMVTYNMEFATASLFILPHSVSAFLKIIPAASFLSMGTILKKA